MRPTLRTARLRMTPLAESDLPHLVAMNGDPEVMRFITGRASTPQEVADELPGLLGDARGMGLWSGYDGATFVGVWFLTVDPDDPEAGELGWRLPRSAWGRGLAVEGACAVVAHGFETLRLQRLWAETMAVNTRSRRVMERLGMRHVRTDVREWDDPIPGWEHGEVRYELTRDDHPNAGLVDSGA